MNPEPRPVGDDSEQIMFDADNRGNGVQVFIGRETVEDYLERETTTMDERLAFVVRNRRIIEHNVAHFLRIAGDEVTGLHLHPDLLFGCIKT